MSRAALLPVLFLLPGALLAAPPDFRDETHQSKILGEPRHYRLFLPPHYAESGKRYPVIYYFHGHSDRYTLEKYDDGKDTVPKISTFVRNHDVIVVSVDGYVARDYTGFYGGSPWDVRIEGGQFDFGEYFLELTSHIDSTYRTLTSRRYRATSGLSMGGFMSAYLSARYPERIGSASIFNPGPEFYVGEPGRRSLWRPKDHVANHGHTMVRLIRASGDYISQYHEETHAAYAASAVDFEYRQDEYHRHWATSIGETFEFHMRAFNTPRLDEPPAEWSYDSAHRRFTAWGARVEGACSGHGFISLDDVSASALRVRTPKWAPDGPPGACTSVFLTTAPLYRAGAAYQVRDYDALKHRLTSRSVTADDKGRLSLQIGGGIHQVGISGPGIPAKAPVLLPLSTRGTLRIRPGTPLTLPLRLFNPGGGPLEAVALELKSEYPTVQILEGKTTLPQLAPGGTASLENLSVRFVAGDGDFARARLRLQVKAPGIQPVSRDFDVLIAPDSLEAPLEVAVLDGRDATFRVFRQQGNQGGGAPIERSVREGSGNGNGVLEPGEQATIWLRLKQGIDPFDKNNWCRAKVYSESPRLEEIDDIQEQKQREWTSAQGRTSVVQLSAGTAPAQPLSMILDCESYSFQSSPDVRYGPEPLYQPFQVHRHHLFRWHLPAR